MKFRIFSHPFQKMVEHNVEWRSFAKSVYLANYPKYAWLHRANVENVCGEVLK